MVILEEMQDGLIYSNLLLKMYLMSLKNNGLLMLNDKRPHTPQTIATCTRHQIGTVERALKIFMELGLVELLTDGTFYMSDIQLLIGQSSTEGERKKRERMRLQQEKLLLSDEVDKCPPILEIEKEIDIDIESKKERDSENGQPSRKVYGKYENVFLTDTELSELQKDLPDKWEHYIDRLSWYMASKGTTYNNHSATILTWAARDAEKVKPTQGIPEYVRKEGESL